MNNRANIDLNLNMQSIIDSITFTTPSVALEEWAKSLSYLYLYPIYSSIVAGFIFWFVFSFLPERRRKKSFGIGVLNDLLTLNNQVFSFFDFLLRHRDHSPSFFQDKIHACSLSEEEFCLALQNKVISETYLNDPRIASQMLVVGNELIKKVAEIDVVIDRLYSFNYFLNSEEVSLLRNMHEKIHRYIPYIESNLSRVDLFPINPSISFMAKSLMELQDDFRELRKIVFKNKLAERNFMIHKVLRLFHLGNYKACIVECKHAMQKFPLDSSLFRLFTIRCYIFLNKKNIAYQLLKQFLLTDADLISHRNNLNPLLSDQAIENLILERNSLEALNKMKQVVQGEDSIFKEFLTNNLKLRTYFAEFRRSG